MCIRLFKLRRMEMLKFNFARNIVSVFLAIILCTTKVLSTGTYTGVILKLPCSARAAGMGNAFGGIADDANATYWNPAGLAQVYVPQLNIFYGKWILDMNYGAMSGVSPLKIGKSFLGVVGISILYLAYGEITKTDINGFVTGESIRANELCASFSYARDVKNIINLGVNFKLLYSLLDRKSAFGASMDLGAFITLKNVCGESILRGLNVGVSAKNFISTPLGYSNSNGKGKELISPEYTFSVGGQVIPNLSASIDVNLFPDYKKPRASLGVEYWIKRWAFSPLALRCGYTYSTYNKFSKALGLTAGFGIIYKNIEIDYAYLPLGRLGSTHYISLMLTQR